MIGSLLLLVQQHSGASGLVPQAGPIDGSVMAAARTAVVQTLSRAEAQDFDAAYQQTGGAPFWLDAERRRTPRSQTAIEMLRGAADDGLVPADYRIDELAALAAVVDRGTAFSTAARFDTQLTASVLRYFRHLHLGRVDPRTLSLQLTVPLEGHDFARLLRDAIAGDRLRQTAADLAPPLWQYGALKKALATTRAASVDASSPPVFRSTVRPGDMVPPDTLAALHRLLEKAGDLAPATPLPADGRYTGALETAVMSFQERHGLLRDGVIGKETQAALSVPLAWRVRQIELALERLRWLPDLSGGRLIAVNIPMFRLWAWNEVPSSAPPVLTMDVIVGRAMRTETPVFAATMEFVVFRPYWNVPSSILRGEMIPAIRRDAAYLSKQNLEIVAGPSDSSPVLRPTPENIASLGRGGVRLRQRPGAANALGLVKLMFPNENDVYMHATPSTALFSRARRDFSHGCIRLADPAALTAWALDDPAWPREAVVGAMNGPANRRVNLGDPVQVVIFYITAAVQPENGRLHFADDVYGHDRRLDRALQGGQQRGSPGI